MIKLSHDEKVELALRLDAKTNPAKWEAFAKRTARVYGKGRDVRPAWLEIRADEFWAFYDNWLNPPTPVKIRREPVCVDRFLKSPKCYDADKNIFCWSCNASLKIDGDQFRDVHGRNGKPHCKKCAEKIDFDRLAKSIRFREMQNREWRLIYGFENERAITTVLADNATKAVELGRVELAKNPSREWYLKKWKESGERVRPSYYGLEKDPVKIKINRCNWSGDETTLSYDPKTGAFEMSHLKGYVFWLERQNCCDEVTGAMFKIRGSQWRADDSLGQVWEGLQKCHYTAFSMGIERDADNPFIAAAQLLCNTV